MGLSQRDQTKHNTLLHLGTQSVKNLYHSRQSFSAKCTHKPKFFLINGSAVMEQILQQCDTSPILT